MSGKHKIVLDIENQDSLCGTICLCLSLSREIMSPGRINSFPIFVSTFSCRSLFCSLRWVIISARLNWRKYVVQQTPQLVWIPLLFEKKNWLLPFIYVKVSNLVLLLVFPPTSSYQNVPWTLSWLSDPSQTYVNISMLFRIDQFHSSNHLSNTIQVCQDRLAMCKENLAIV